MVAWAEPPSLSVPHADHSGELDAKELQRALELGSLRFGLTDVDAMVRAFDTRGRRKLNLEEFSKLHAFLTSVQNSFSYFDQDRSRTLQMNEVVQALKHAGQCGARAPCAVCTQLQLLC